MSDIILKNSSGMEATYSGITALRVPSTTAGEFITYSEGGGGGERFFLFLGDSYADAASSETSWVTYVINILGLTSNSYAKIAVSGSGFISNGQTQYLFKTQLENYVGDRNAVTDIVVAGGLNDSSSAITEINLSTAIQQFTVYARTQYPNARIWIGYIGSCRDNGELVGGRTVEYRRACKQVYYSTARQNNVNVMNGIEYALSIDANYLGSDNVHPSAQGAEEIGKGVASFLSGGIYVAYKAPTSISIIPAGDLVFYDNDFKIEVNGAFSTIFMKNYFSIDATSLGTIAAGNTITIGTLPHNVYINEAIALPVDCRIDNYNSKPYQFVMGTLVLSGDEVMMHFQEMNSSGTGYATFVPIQGSIPVIRFTLKGWHLYHVVRSDVNA